MIRRINYRTLTLLSALACLFIGLSIYIIFRPDNLYLNQGVSFLIGSDTMQSLRTIVSEISFIIPDWIIYSLPDALWMFALMLVILIIWDFRLTRQSIPWIILAVTAGILFEIGQGLNIIKGTFDPVDAICILICASVPLLFTLLRSRVCRLN